MKIKSSIRNYTVEFSNNFIKSIDQIYNDGDIIIFDNILYTPELDKYRCIQLYNVTEQTKDFNNISTIINYIIGKFNKKNKLIAIGGGITQDVVGFISSILFRGVEWIFYPTTLLAQGDSCIGGKTSINFNTYKNQLGNFYPPYKVIVCNEFLDTLTKIDIKSGLGEMLHFFLVSSKADYDFFIKNQHDFKKLTTRCLDIKRSYIEIDEFDKNERLILNYGHTFGHAIEAVTNNEIAHGIAVSVGMDVANFISYKKGYITYELFKRIQKTLSSIYYDVKLPNIEQLIIALKKDKKNISNKLNCVLTKGPGNMFLEEVEYSEIESYLTEYNATR
jgi:3-dehydroquinate synthase